MKKYLASLRVRILAELYILKTYFKQYPAFRRAVANDMAEAINAEMAKQFLQAKRSKEFRDRINGKLSGAEFQRKIQRH